MAVNKVGKEWTKQDTLKSGFLFFMHFIILALICGVLVLWNQRNNLIQHFQTVGANYIYALFCAMMLVFIMYLYFFFENKNTLSTGKNIALVFAILEISFLLSWIIGERIDRYARPIAFAALMASSLIGRREAIFINIINSLLVFIADTFVGGISAESEYYSSLMISFSAGALAIFLCEKAKTRFHIVGVGIIIVIPIDLIIMMLGLPDLVSGAMADMSVWTNIFREAGYGLLGGVASAILFLTVLPIFEIIFNCLTVYRLRELTSPDAKILKEMKREAPGTYIHSTVVAQLAEASAAAIGENVDVARAAAMYHDVGKLHYPEHFTENQGNGYNVHDELTPELSADIIRSHAKDGYTLIKNHKLPDFLADVALQHHGTMPIRYFYAKALKMTDGELNIEDYSYLGPKPQTKIAAIIMIADAAEAAVRAVNAKKPEEAEKSIRGIIEERMDLEQFSECEITMVDLTRIRQALVSALTGVHHHRVKYPNIKYKRTENGTKGENV